MQDRFARYRESFVAHDHVALEGDAVVLHSEPPSLLPSDALGSTQHHLLHARDHTEMHSRNAKRS